MAAVRTTTAPMNHASFTRRRRLRAARFRARTPVPVSGNTTVTGWSSWSRSVIRRRTIEATRADAVDHRRGEQVVERPAVDEASAQVGARHLEARSLQAPPGPPRRRTRLLRSRAGGDDDRRQLADLLAS